MSGRDLQAIILDLLRERQAGRSICPSEAARRAAYDGDDWRSLMPAIREAAGELARTGRIAVTQRGVPVDPATVQGPIRLILRSDTS